MYKITEKVALNPTVTKMVIEAPLIAKKAKPAAQSSTSEMALVSTVPAP